MSYLLKIKERLPNYLVTEELTYNWKQEDGNSIVIKYLGGQVYNGNKALPIQLLVYTDDVENVMEELEEFVETYSDNTYYDDLDYVREFYYTPSVVNNFNTVFNNYISTIIIVGTLVISENTSDIKEIKIDGNVVYSSGASLVYVGNVDNQRIIGKNINEADIINGMVRLSFTTNSKANGFSTKIRNIRTGVIGVNAPFNIKITFTDNDVEENYVMKLDNASLVTTRDGLPFYTISFTA